ncbi:MAG: hypothetical protein AAB767_03120 [Patescibacteria group bacterium]
MLRRLVVVFIFAFLPNLIWEHLHSVLYVSYQGGAITNLILFRAALFDATVITVVAFLPLSLLGRRRVGGGVAFLFLLLFAILLEKWALATGRWAYTDAMQIIPILNVGLTPVIQLGILGYVSRRVADWFCG